MIILSLILFTIGVTLFRDRPEASSAQIFISFHVRLYTVHMCPLSRLFCCLPRRRKLRSCTSRSNCQRRRTDGGVTFS
ncbi:hypothetical protein DFJ58DRAFT_755765 [Suillus subalutaceus]|uniref:uncharacterized protein n=1 Tax=Suillus subalutaceus TaxID=48586 RepID=UPI001B8793E0|nr:uncharacterized protein DFJ58DRAFT_755765 [Suillus subalutaceus]KAG1876680.1 hypothetical protein DFJ58DRAFT_755765 [Suillus subalutaceus]